MSAARGPLMRRGTKAHQALLVLGLAGGGLNRTALLRRSGLTKDGMNAALHALQRKGLARVQYVELTEKGKATLELLAVHARFTTSVGRAL